MGRKTARVVVKATVGQRKEHPISLRSPSRASFCKKEIKMFFSFGKRTKRPHLFLEKDAKSLLVFQGKEANPTWDIPLTPITNLAGCRSKKNDPLKGSVRHNYFNY